MCIRADIQTIGTGMVSMYFVLEDAPKSHGHSISTFSSIQLYSQKRVLLPFRAQKAASGSPAVAQNREHNAHIQEPFSNISCAHSKVSFRNACIGANNINYKDTISDASKASAANIQQPTARKPSGIKKRSFHMQFQFHQ